MSARRLLSGKPDIGADMAPTAGFDPVADLGRRKALLLVAPPFEGWDAPAIAPVCSEQFTSARKTRRPLYGRLSGR
jgi:hypothetical protein